LLKNEMEPPRVKKIVRLQLPPKGKAYLFSWAQLSYFRQILRMYDRGFAVASHRSTVVKEDDRFSGRCHLDRAKRGSLRQNLAPGNGRPGELYPHAVGVVDCKGVRGECGECLMGGLWAG
jgi:hypothetical protein